MSKSNSPLINKIAASGLIVLKPEVYLPREELRSFDLKDFLFKGLILQEKPFREALKNHDWEQYEGRHLAVYCSVNAIIPMWAYMLITSHAQPHALQIFFGDEAAFYRQALYEAFNQIDFEQYKGQRVIIKGCSDRPVPPDAYVELTRRLRPVAKSIMFGEPCSTVPIYKQPRK